MAAIRSMVRSALRMALRVKSKRVLETFALHVILKSFSLSLAITVALEPCSFQRVVAMSGRDGVESLLRRRRCQAPNATILDDPDPRKVSNLEVSLDPEALRSRLLATSTEVNVGSRISEHSLTFASEQCVAHHSGCERVPMQK